MQVQVRSSSGITLVPMDVHLMNARKIFIEGEINQESACEFAKEIMVLTREDQEKPIDVLINSPGGDILSGLLIYDVIQASTAPLRMFCLGRAYSMGAVLFASGSHGRYMLPHSELMLHEPLLGSQVGGSASSIQSISESLTEAKTKINRILAKHTGRTEEEIEKATRFDHYYSPEESISFGLADRIVGFDKIMEG
ncbi:MAG: ATP-dependent Clp protease proteolytic subunit [Lachnospiraceae bacterium]|nr:ATP-dependent Clp protease proteolytic subunit [Lachnospiraceae bacterium]